jgi:hypothetical protein
MNSSCEKEIQLTDKVKPDVVRVEVSLYKKKPFYMNVCKDSTISEFYYQLYFTLFPEWYEILKPKEDKEEEEEEEEEPRDENVPVIYDVFTCNDKDDSPPILQIKYNDFCTIENLISEHSEYFDPTSKSYKIYVVDSESYENMVRSFSLSKNQSLYQKIGNLLSEYFRGEN